MRTKTMFAIGRWVLGTAAIAAIGYQYWEIQNLNGKLAHPAKSPAGAHANNATAARIAQAKAIELNNPDLARILAIPDKLDRLRALLDFTQGLNGPDLCTVLEKMAADPAMLRGDNNLAMNILVARLAQIDPKGALDWAQSKLKGAAQRDILASLFDAWSSLDPKAALAAIDQLGNVSERTEFELDAFKNMANRDPAGALKILQSLPPGEQTHDNYQAIFTAWAANDPAGASAAVLSMPPSRNRDFAIENVLQGWAQTDPRGALAWAATLPGGVRASALSTALGNLALQDPQAAVDYINGLSNPADRNNLMSVVAMNWGKVDPAGALAWVDQNTTGQAHDTAVLNLMGQLSQTDPAKAASLMGDLPVRMQAQAISQIATNWAQQDPKAAINWVQQQAGGTPNAQMKNLEVNLINNMTNVDPAGAAAFMQTMQDNPLYNRLIEQVAANWVGADPQAAMNWAKSLPPDGGGNNAMLQVITQYTNKDPQAAWQMAAALPDGALRDQTMTNVVGKYAAIDPSAAAALLTNLPDSSQVNMTNQIAQTWLNQDPHAAEQWINTLPAGAPRDVAVQQIINVEGSNDLPTAFTWATTISNPELQSLNLNRVVQQWARTDPAAAAQTVQNAGITDQQRTNLLNIIQRLTPPTTTN